MFQQTFIEATARTNRGWTVLTSAALQLVLIAALLAVPLVRPEMLPKTLLQTMLALPPTPPPAPPAPAATQLAHVQRPVPRPFDSKHLFEPREVPDKVAMLNDADLSEAIDGVPGGVPNGVPGGTGTAMSPVFTDLLAPPAPAPPAAKPAAPAAVPRVRLGGQILQGKLIYAPKPSYPVLALRARVEGQVQLAAVIARDGAVLNLTVVSGHPLLVQAALDAVRHWRYAPTLLNGDPVEVISTIVVNFTLNH
jgi:protein TonB